MEWEAISPLTCLEDDIMEQSCFVQCQYQENSRAASCQHNPSTYVSVLRLHESWSLPLYVVVLFRTNPAKTICCNERHSNLPSSSHSPPI